MQTITKLCIALAVLITLASQNLIAQAPQKMSYQAVIRNATGELVKSKPVGMRVSILQGSATGQEVYKETMTGTTNANGLLSLVIGSGTPVAGSLASIDWGTGNYFIKTETDPDGGSSYSVEGSSQLLSVPYALYAQKGGSIQKGNNKGDILYWNGTDWVSLSPKGNGLLLTMCDGVPTWGPCPTKVPVLTTKDASCRSGQSFTAGGEVLLDGGSPVTERGLCWSVNPNPTIADSKTSDGKGNGIFTSVPTGLTPNTQYYFRAYATNDNGTAYGNEYTITTPTDTTPVIGCYYQGGILYYLLQEGDPGYSKDTLHGLIMMSEDKFPGLIPFGCYGYLNQLFLGFNIGDGRSNTNLIIENCPETYSAARICKNYSANGYNDWYMPSRDEAIKLYQFFVTTGKIWGATWTSSKFQNQYAIALGFQPTEQSVIQPFNVITIRSF